MFRRSVPLHVGERESARFAQLRRWMVEKQLRRRGINDSRVLAAMLQVPREEFVPASARDRAYDDGALHIGLGQTISQPFTVAYMLQALTLEGTEKVLEVGTGSGYGAAVLSRLVQVVHTVERLGKLGMQARQRLDRLGYANVQVHIANGTLGLPAHAPFNAIVATAGADDLPQPYQDQLADVGRIVIPIGAPTSQTLYCVTKKGKQFTAKDLGAFAFVPLIGRHGWSQSQSR